MVSIVCSIAELVNTVISKIKCGQIQEELQCDPLRGRVRVDINKASSLPLVLLTVSNLHTLYQPMPREDSKQQL